MFFLCQAQTKRVSCQMVAGDELQEPSVRETGRSPTGRVKLKGSCLLETGARAGLGPFLFWVKLAEAQDGTSNPLALLPTTLSGLSQPSCASPTPGGRFHYDSVAN